MNTRRIKLAAMAILINGVAALMLTSANPALAASCAPTANCYAGSDLTCPSIKNNICLQGTPAGCTLTAATCIPNQCPTFFTRIVCQYAPI